MNAYMAKVPNPYIGSVQSTYYIATIIVIIVFTSKDYEVIPI